MVGSFHQSAVELELKWGSGEGVREDFEGTLVGRAA